MSKWILWHSIMMSLFTYEISHSIFWHTIIMSQFWIMMSHLRIMSSLWTLWQTILMSQFRVMISWCLYCDIPLLCHNLGLLHLNGYYGNHIWLNIWKCGKHFLRQVQRPGNSLNDLLCGANLWQWCQKVTSRLQSGPWRVVQNFSWYRFSWWRL